jgi:diguanylate cyclase (GGDEF)-like protein/PAS domain S-box-containing protein
VKVRAMSDYKRMSPLPELSDCAIESIGDALPIGVMVTNDLGNCVYTNEAYFRLIGRSAEEVLGSHWSAAVHPQDRQGVLESCRLSKDGGSPRVSESRLIRNDGAVLWIRRNVAELDASRPGSGQVHTIENISDAKRAEQVRLVREDALLAEKERAQVTLESIGDAVISTDVHGNVTYMNVVAEAMTGWTRENALSRPLARTFNVVDATTREPAANPAQRAIDEDRTVDLAMNCVLLRRDGGEVEIEDSAAPIHNRDGAVTGAVIVFRDAKFSHATTMRMAHLARHDGLTGLLNRTALDEQLTQILRLARRHGDKAGLLFIDLDNFKHVNDTLGHQCGDQLLTAVSRELEETVRATDTVCRYGGDEFVVLLSELERSSDADLVARKLESVVAAPRLIDGHEIALTLSIGISVYPDDGEDPATLLQRADAAMFRAKSAGGHSRTPEPMRTQRISQPSEAIDRYQHSVVA